MATAEQAANASAPQPGLEGAAAEEEDELMAEDAQEEPLLSANNEEPGKGQVPISSLPVLPHHGDRGSTRTFCAATHSEELERHFSLLS